MAFFECLSSGGDAEFWTIIATSTGNAIRNSVVKQTVDDGKYSGVSTMVNSDASSTFTYSITCPYDGVLNACLRNNANIRTTVLTVGTTSITLSDVGGQNKSFDASKGQTITVKITGLPTVAGATVIFLTIGQKES